MTNPPSDPANQPSSPDELLARARRRGTQIRRRRRITTVVGGAALAALAVALPVSVAGGESTGHLVRVANPSQSTSVPATNPEIPSLTTLVSPSTTIGQPSGGTVPTPSGSTVTSQAPTTTRSTQQPVATTVPSPRTITVTDADNGQTISVPVGSTVIVQLSADNWVIGPSSQPAVLAIQGAPSHQPTQCVPGGTCGTTTATFRALQPGQAQVSASRNYCGEAIRCTPTTDSWSVTVQVTR